MQISSNNLQIKTDYGFKNGKIIPLPDNFEFLTGKIYDNKTLLSNNSTKWGFKIDENGFFGTEFNQATGIPENIKIHQTMMAQAEDYSKSRGDNIDPLTILSKSWNVYKTLTKENLENNNNEYLTLDEINKIPKSYVSKGSLLDGIVSINKTEAQEQKTGDENSFLFLYTRGDQTPPSLSNGFNIIHPISDEQSLNMYKEDYKFLTGNHYDKNAPTNKLSITELFTEFFFQKTESEIDYPEQTKATKKYYELLESGKDIKTYLSETMDTKSYDDMIKSLGAVFDKTTGKVTGEFDQNLVDKFFEELDKSMKENYQEYKANKYSYLDKSNQEDNNNNPTSNITKAYHINSKNASNGKLINIMI